ncbi:translation initiation factor IF-2 [Paenibacillus sp. MSJ-34]|uniref:translation initiation factor IF-2 n=1 Tax=Paenibacillus sp. MSJ-34 TaxID=2841529 RepID=UPI001C0F7370|nr:translation initiation factor IF-2 [Paenibacillus sp. MSJ-34]MBU5441809.1 translation initiation factor IF-2 [Paenibacillus sp. MSJ-34]
MSKQDNKDNKDKLRVYEYAKSLNMSSKEIITILKRLNIPVNNHMSVMENDAVARVEQFFRDIKANAAAKRAAQESGAQTAQVSAAAKPGAASSNAAGTAAAAKPNHQPQQEKQASARKEGGAGQGQGRSQQHSRDGHREQQQNRQREKQVGMNTQRTQEQRKQQGNAGQGQGRQQGQNNGNQGNNQHGGNQRQGRPAFQQQQSRPESGRPQGGQQPNRNQPKVQGNDSHDSTPAFNKSKKTKLNPRRFDDNKVSNYKGNQNNKGGRNKFGKGQHQAQEKREKIDNTPKKIIVRGTMTVGETAKLLHKDASEVIKKLMFLGVMATINQELDLDTIQLLASDFNVEVELKIPVEEDRFETIEENDDEADLIERPPVVTIMGHVDHGKTTLLDAIRSTNVSSSEAGGITQHIGAYQVEINKKKITFLDTPGHEAFTTMRARGAQVTDITIIVVAADDGVMPQTVEAISHAKAANVPIIVAVNKIDKPTANPDKVKQELTEYELVPEEWGGDTIFVNVSAKQRMGLESLLEMILLVAEVNEFKANPNKRARGTVIEAELDKGRGPVARILVQHGTLKVGDAFVAGNCFGRVRAMVNDKGRRLKEAGPSTPIEITGLTEVPQAGDPFMAFEDERKARSIAEKRAITQRQSELNVSTRVTLDDLFKHIKEGEIKDLNVIIKGDVQGSVEALKGSLEKIEVEGVRVKIIHSGAGAITESDVILAAASNAIVIGFNVRPEPQAKITAEQEKVDVRLHRVIYNVIEEIEQAMKGMLDPVYRESVIGHAEVRNTFKISKIGTIAGCMVTSGKITRNAEARLIRDGIVIFEGKIDSLKRFKDDAKEVAQGYECGITLERFNDVKEGDIVEAFVMETVER